MMVAEVCMATSVASLCEMVTSNASVVGVLCELVSLPAFSFPSGNETGRTEINVLPLHHLGREKYPLLGQVYTGWQYPVLTPEQMSEIRQTFTVAGIRCYIGLKSPF